MVPKIEYGPVGRDDGRYNRRPLGAMDEAGGVARVIGFSAEAYPRDLFIYNHGLGRLSQFEECESQPYSRQPRNAHVRPINTDRKNNDTAQFVCHTRDSQPLSRTSFATLDDSGFLASNANMDATLLRLVVAAGRRIRG
jgi:hypothetical protein